MSDYSVLKQRFADGAEILLISSITRQIETEWNLKNGQAGSIVSVVFIGALIGNLCSGWLGDRYGRRPTILLGYAFVIFGSVGSAYHCSGYWSLLLYRFLVGWGFGVPGSSTFALNSEIVPSTKRIIFAAVPKILESMGEFYGATLFYFTDPSLQNIDWRYLILLGTVPSFFLLFLSVVFLIESPHYLAVRNQRQEARKVIESMAYMNGSDIQAEDLVLQEDSSESEVEVEQRFGEHLKHLLSPKFFYTTLAMCFVLFTTNFFYYGFMFALPHVLVGSHLPVSPAGNLMIGSSFQFIGVIIGVVVFTGMPRKTSMIALVSVVGMSTFVFTICVHPHILGGLAVNSGICHFLAMVALFVQKMGAMMSFLVSYVYLCEVYPTVVRASGPAFVIAIGRLG